jgi:uncharacterized protein (DUF1015 family)
VTALRAEPYENRVVLPHERTHAGPKEGRLRLLRATRTQLEPLFFLWDGTIEVDGLGEPDLQSGGDSLWRLGAEFCEALTDELRDAQLLIADGHHRYETALNYWYEAVSAGAEPPTGADSPNDDEQPAAHVLAFLAAFEDPGMVILPTHRELVSSGGADAARVEQELAATFALERFPATPAGEQDLVRALENVGEDRHGFGIALKGLPHVLLATKPVKKGASPLDELDVKVLHDDILDGALARAGGKDEKLAYSIDALPLLERVRKGELEGAFLMNATRPEQMAAVCRAGELMPHKSTYFYPKLLTGLVFHSLD